MSIEEIVKVNQPDEYKKIKSKWGLSKPLSLLEKFLDKIVDPILEWVM